MCGVGLPGPVQPRRQKRREGFISCVEEVRDRVLRLHVSRTPHIPTHLNAAECNPGPQQPAYSPAK